MSYPLNEPQRGKDILLSFNQWLVSQETLAKFVPLLADGIVLTYPVLLVRRYLRADHKKDNTNKYGALYVTTSAVVVIIVAIIIQSLVDKMRPEGYIGNADLLILDHLPTAPFPSDHASVGFAVATATLLWGYKQKLPVLKMIGWILLGGAAVMSMARVGAGVHWPTDVLMGACIGIGVAWLLSLQSIYTFCKRWIYRPLVQLQEWLFSRFLGREYE